MGSATPRRSLIRALGTGRARLALAIVIGAALAAGAGTAAVRFAHAATFSVCASGCTFTDIQTAINDPGTHNGDTIVVGPGTYSITSTINVNKSVTIEGAQHGVDASTRSATPSPSTESIIDGTALAPAVGFDFAISAINVTIDGFVMQKAAGGAVYGPTASGLTLENNIIQDSTAGLLEFAGSGITVQQNVFQNLDDPAYSGLPVDGDAIYDDFTFDNLTVTQNIIRNAGQAITLVENPSNPVSHVTITHNQMDDPSFLWNATGSFSNNAITGNAAVVDTFGGPTIGLKLGGSDTNFTVDHNTFTDLQGYSVKTTADNFGAPYIFADDSNVSITNNVLDDNVGDNTDNAFSAILDIRNLQGTSTISGNTTILSGTFSAGGATAVYGVKVQGANTQTLAISNNLLNGGNVGVGTGNTAPPTSGIAVADALGRTSALTITGNQIDSWVDGIASGNLDVAAQVTAHQNCIVGNSTFGASNGSGAGIKAEQNWWGSPAGPFPPNNPVSSNVDGTNWLTSAASICAVPTATLSAGTPTYTSGGTTFVTSATPLTVTGSEPGGTIKSVSYRFCANGCPSAQVYTTATGATASFTLTGADGKYEIDYYASDTTGNSGAAQAAFYTLDNTPPATTLTIGQPQLVGSGGIVEVNSTTPLTLGATDAGSGVASVEYRVFPKGGTAPAFTVVTGATVTFKVTGPDGVYEVDYDAADHLGNDPVQTTFVQLANATLVNGADVASGSGTAGGSGSPPAGANGGPTSQGSTTTLSGTDKGWSGKPVPATRRLPTAAPTGVSPLTLGLILALLLLVAAGGGGFLYYRSQRLARR